MADNSESPAPVKATGARRTMAPAARRAEGEDERASRVEQLAKLSDGELNALEADIRAARTHKVRHPSPPSFGMSEGERAELEMNGKTTSPWTGEEITGDGEPRSSTDK